VDSTDKTLFNVPPEKSHRPMVRFMIRVVCISSLLKEQAESNGKVREERNWFQEVKCTSS
jgi:hypothetical protein